MTTTSYSFRLRASESNKLTDNKIVFSLTDEQVADIEKCKSLLDMTSISVLFVDADIRPDECYIITGDGNRIDIARPCISVVIEGCDKIVDASIFVEELQEQFDFVMNIEV